MRDIKFTLWGSIGQWVWRLADNLTIHGEKSEGFFSPRIACVSESHLGLPMGCWSGELATLALPSLYAESSILRDPTLYLQNYYDDAKRDIITINFSSKMFPEITNAEHEQYKLSLLHTSCLFSFCNKVCQVQICLYIVY